ncbi:TniB family NTP-binding protein [Deefgea sp. CFH1-16]|uniref:TniB family NTP-binding protein n=1 Tax=Deefgea sp. CFH1-16 TaxID=2675457 RepID=UPI0015F6C755|nr:TniB family NTP-binding protein [Deefgea sp. CFH1-16]MBM5575316.1 AAA family ATPase [Deefgea sp. CFH1-16]
MNTQYLKMSDSLLALKNIYIQYPRFTALLSEVERVHQESDISSEPLCMILTGETGTGKSTLIAQYLKRWPREVTDEGLRIPVLKAEVPLPATISAMVSSMLGALGAVNPTRGKVEERRIRLVELVRRCGVRLIILDEFQHLVERGTPSKIAQVADWIKSLINELGIPFVLVGVPTAKAVLEHSDQLARRFKIRRGIMPMDFIKSPQEFMKLLELYDQKLPFSKQSGLAEPGIAERVFLATRGVFGHLATLLQEAGRLALLEHSVRLESKYLEQAFDLYLAETMKLRANPFTISSKEVERWITNLEAA